MILLQFVCVMAALVFVVVVLRIVMMEKPDRTAFIQKAQSIFGKAPPVKQTVYRSPSEKRNPLDKIS